jgi:hypothetical protein
MLAPERGVDALLGAHTNFALIDSKAAAAAEKLAFLCCDGPDANYASEDNRFLFGMHTRSSLYTVDFIRHMLNLTPAPRSVFVATKGPGIVFTEETCAAALAEPDADAGLLNLTAHAYSGNATEVVEDLLDRAEAAAADVLIVCSLGDDGKSIMAAIDRRQLYFSGALLTVAPTLKAVVGDLPVSAAKYKLSATQWHPSLATAAPAAGAPLWPTSEAYAKAFEAAKGKELLNYNSAAASATGYVLQLAVAEPHGIFPGLSLSLARRLALASASSLLALRLSQLWPVRERVLAGGVLRLGLLRRPGQLLRIALAVARRVPAGRRPAAAAAAAASAAAGCRRLAESSSSSAASSHLHALRLSQLWPVRERLFAGRVLRLGLLQQPGQLPLIPPPRRCSFFPRAETPP